jgi:protein O-GlcNAc transferase
LRQPREISARNRGRCTTRVVFAVALASSFVFTGCSTRTNHFTNQFVKPGKPSVTLDDPMAPKQESLGDWTRRLRAIQEKARTKNSLLPSIESQNPALAAALLKLVFQETAENHRLVAAAYRSVGVEDYAYRHLQRAVLLEPCDSASREALARLWRDWHLPQLALADAHRAVYCRPQSASAYNTLGTVLEALGQHANARSAFEFALRLDDRASYALNNLCYVALQTGDAPAAQQNCEKALALQPTLSAASNNLALALAMQGDVQKAEARLRDSRDPATGQYNVGILRMSLGRYEDAADAFQLAAAAKPSLVDAARRAEQARKAAAAMEQD